MRYIIYDSLDEQAYEELKDRIISIEEKVSPFVSQSGFYLNADSIDGDGLGLDYCFDDRGIMGSIGFTYDDSRDGGDFVFYLYVLKAYDNLNVRCYKKERFPDGGIGFGEIEEDPLFFFRKCIETFKVWNKNDLVEKVSIG